MSSNADLRSRAHRLLERQADQLQKMETQASLALGVQLETLLKSDVSPSRLQALSEAAEETGKEKGIYAGLARTAVKEKLNRLTEQWGDRDTHLKFLREKEQEREEKYQEIQKNVDLAAKLEKRGEMVRKHNDRSGSYRIDQNARLSLAERVGWMNATFEGQGGKRNAQDVLIRYKDEYGSDYFKDTDKLEETSREIKRCRDAHRLVEQRYYRMCAAYSDIVACMDQLETHDSRVDREALKGQLSKLFRDRAFVGAYAKRVPGQEVAPLLLPALKAEICEGIRRGVFETLGNALEPANESADGGEEPAAREDLLVLAGYVFTNSVKTMDALEAFDPPVVEGPESLRREFQMQAISQQHVDPAFVSEFCGLDRTAGEILEISPRPRMNFKATLADKDALADVDPVFADYLGNVSDETLRDIGLASIPRAAEGQAAPAPQAA